MMKVGPILVHILLLYEYLIINFLLIGILNVDDASDARACSYIKTDLIMLIDIT